MLHTGLKDWKLVKSSPGQDQQGRRSIDFELDERGGTLFSERNRQKYRQTALYRPR